jgi:hypothetical protein
MFRFKARADPSIFQRGNSMPLSLAFKTEGSTIGFQRGGGPLLVFKWGMHLFTLSLSPVLSHVLTGGKGGGSDHWIILYSTEIERNLYHILIHVFGECLKNNKRIVDHNSFSRLNLCKYHNICIRC